MSRLSLIANFDEFNERGLAEMRPGGSLESIGGHRTDGDYSVEQAEARFFHKRLGALLDGNLPMGKWRLDWSNRGAMRPTLYLSYDLFEHVREAIETA